MGEIKTDSTRDEKIKAAEKVEIVILVDNYVDLLLPDHLPFAIRPPLGTGTDIPKGTFLAEHGLSLFVNIYGDKNYKILFDTGYTETCIKNNMERLRIKEEEIDAIVISHFHMDHTGGLKGVLRCKKVPVFVHPDAFIYPRYMQLPDKRKLIFPRTLVKEDLIRMGVDVVETKEPSLICNGFALVTGEIERSCPFEKGMPNLMLERDGKIEKDLILDDQALVILIKEKGLVVISGCAHSGIINTILYAKKITGIDSVYAVLGGFHLSGPIFEPAIDPTLDELKKMDIKVLVPMHCTGWKAIKRMSEIFSSFILSSVGTKIVL